MAFAPMPFHIRSLLIHPVDGHSLGYIFIGTGPISICTMRTIQQRRMAASGGSNAALNPVPFILRFSAVSFPIYVCGCLTITLTNNLIVKSEIKMAQLLCITV
jgi:Na+/H+ antiporter NhaB